MDGKKVSLADMLTCRERRAMLQNQMIEKYHKPLISYCMNIPGPVKTNSAIRTAFMQGKDMIISELGRLHFTILENTEQHVSTGDELLLCIDAPAQKLKSLALNIEGTHPAGRLFDIDVLNADGEKLSRREYRKCLVCGKQAQECARARTHSVSEMQEAVEKILRGNK